MANKHQQDKPENNKEFMNMDKPKFQAQIQVINLNTIKDLSGNISILESCIDLPFEIKRIYYIWNTTKNIPRGNHAHKSLAQGFIAMNGSCEDRKSVV